MPRSFLFHICLSVSVSVSQSKFVILNLSLFSCFHTITYAVYVLTYRSTYFDSLSLCLYAYLSLYLCLLSLCLSVCLSLSLSFSVSPFSENQDSTTNGKKKCLSEGKFNVIRRAKTNYKSGTKRDVAVDSRWSEGSLCAGPYVKLNCHSTGPF